MLPPSTTSTGTVRGLFIFAYLAAAGCRPAEDPAAAAAVYVVEDLVPRAPDAFTAVLTEAWQDARTGQQDRIPEGLLKELQQVSGLPLAGDIAHGSDAGVVILYLFEPVVVRADSVRVLAGWSGLSGGDDGGAWGVEYDYALDCSRRCRLLADVMSTRWN